MTTFRFGDFEWDEAKARANLRYIPLGVERQLRVVFVVSACSAEGV
jgi:hypothetical protein